MYQEINISEDWKVFHQDLDMGLFGNSGRAYQYDYVPEDAVTTSVPATAPAAFLEAGKN